MYSLLAFISWFNCDLEYKINANDLASITLISKLNSTTFFESSAKKYPNIKSFTLLSEVDCPCGIGSRSNALLSNSRPSSTLPTLTKTSP